MNNRFGHIVRQWRDIRRFSQLALSAESGISSRHISFLETGRAQPSRGSVLTLARVLDMPKPATNEALLAAGFAPEYAHWEADDADMVPINIAISSILENHMPLPGIVIDAGWNIVGGNAAAQSMISVLPFADTLNVVDAILNDDVDNPQFINWQDVAQWTKLRLQTEMMREGGRGPLASLYHNLANDPRLPHDELMSFADYGPVLTMQVRAGDSILNMFTMLAEFSTVQDVTMSERRVELFFPADEATRAFFDTL